MPAFPSEEELKKIRKQMARVKGSQALPPNATALDRAKYDVCEQLLIYMQKNKMSQRELAKLLKTSETRVSEFLHYRIQKFTLDKLVSFLQMVRPMVVVKIA